MQYIIRYFADSVTPLFPSNEDRTMNNEVFQYRMLYLLILNSNYMQKLILPLVRLCQ